VIRRTVSQSQSHSLSVAFVAGWLKIGFMVVVVGVEVGGEELMAVVLVMVAIAVEVVTVVVDVVVGVVVCAVVVGVGGAAVVVVVGVVVLGGVVGGVVGGGGGGAGPQELVWNEKEMSFLHLNNKSNLISLINILLNVME